MANVLDYLRWRGDLTFTQDGFHQVDSLVVCAMTYIRWESVLEPEQSAAIAELAEKFLRLPDAKMLCRGQNDLEVLAAAAATRRYGETRIAHYRTQFLPEEDTQFAAMTFLLDDGTICLGFRGTDNTLVGWKEDFNMCFQNTVPSQLLAQDYVRELYSEYLQPMILCGHSKGGNLAVFAGARSSPMIQESILAVYNNDGPGFTDYLMGDPGYLALVPKIHLAVPHSSVIGLLMSHEEPYIIVGSTQVGILQHDTFSWEVQGRELVTVPQLTPDAVFLHSAIENWLAEMDRNERNQMVEALFTLLSQGDVKRAADIFQPKNLRTYLKLMGTDENLRRVLSTEFENFLDAAKKAAKPSQELQP